MSDDQVTFPAAVDPLGSGGGREFEAARDEVIIAADRLCEEWRGFAGAPPAPPLERLLAANERWRKLLGGGS